MNDLITQPDAGVNPATGRALRAIPPALANIKPLVPIKQDTPNTGEYRDEAGADSFNISHMEMLVKDSEEQPNGWRDRADLAHAYVDGKQLTELQQYTLVAEGMRDVKAINLVGRVMNGIAGQEAKSRTDVKIEADSEESAEVCDVFNPKLKEAQRETFADMAVSQAYRGQTIGGIGWVEVGRNEDPLDYPYRVDDVHRAEMWWDWRDRDMLLRKARWIARVQWKDLDELESSLPKHRTILRCMAGGWFNYPLSGGPIEEQEMEAAYRIDQRWHAYRRRTDWYDGARKRVKLYEVWYRIKAMGVILHWSATKRTLLDPASLLHRAAIDSGRVKVTRQPTWQVRKALYAGPHRLTDEGTTRRSFPFVPFFAYRDDEDASPYGMVEGMIAPQDEYNARRLRINWLLRARQVYIDSDALDDKSNTLKEVLEQTNRPDATVVLNPNRKSGQFGFRIESNLSLQKEQLEVMADAKQLIQDVPGVYGSQLGQQSSGVTSGIANSLLIEQGAVAMGDLNDNYRMSRRKVFELVLDEMVQDHLDADLQEFIGFGENRRPIILNGWDPEKGAVINDVRDAAMRVGLGDVPATPAFKLQQQQTIATIITALGAASPEAVRVLAPSFIESTDLPSRKEDADTLRRMTGIPTAANKVEQQEQQKQQAAQAAEQEALRKKAEAIELAKGEAEVRKLGTAADLDEAKATEIGAGIGMSEMEHDLARQTAAPNPEDQAIAQQEQDIEAAIAEAQGGMQGGMPPQQAQQQPALAAA